MLEASERSMQTQEAKPCLATSGEIQAFEGSIGADRLPESGEGLHWHRCGKAGKSQARVGSGGVSGFTGLRVCVCVCVCVWRGSREELRFQRQADASLWRAWDVMLRRLDVIQ